MRSHLFTALACSVGLAACVHAQTTKPSNLVSVEGHVLKPTQLEPTDERVRKHLKVPAGFTISKFAEGLKNTRMLCVNPDTGDVYVSRREQGDLLLLKDTNNDGVADSHTTVARRPMLHGLAIHQGRMYIVTVRDVYVADISADGTLGELERIIDDLPEAGQHPNRTLAVGPDNMLYITVGSTCNACDETNPEHATIVRATLDGKTRTIFASGLRNTVGFGWHKSGRMWGMDHGIDWLGDNEQKEELNEIQQGRTYGWPYIYADGKENPQDEPPGEVTLAEWKQMSTDPVQLYTAHSAPMQLAFYNGTAFPQDYQGDAFVAMRGSWNRNPPSGYEVVRIHFDDNGNATKVEPFITGWLVDQGDGNFAHLGRLAGCAVAKDGALLIADDANGVIYRVSHAENAQN
jgi:glucose/arabinose dehydrogenase